MNCNFSIDRIEKDIVYLIDNDIGRSVTNSAEEVTKYINLKYPNKRIIYKDTCGEWSELNHIKGRFLSFAPFYGE